MQPITLVTGSGGLVGSESVRSFSALGHKVIGIDNDMRCHYFGPEASTCWQVELLKETAEAYEHCDMDIRDRRAIDWLFRMYNSDIRLIVHTAAQPSHDWAAKEPLTDFDVNATGTLNLLEAARNYCPEATFIFCSTNKVYGDRPNSLPLVELESRWELPADHPYHEGIDELMSLDGCKHSIFGASKVAADIMVQEYGRYFGMKTVCFRGGCLTGPTHSGAMLHGFLSYLMKCAVTGRRYEIFGYKAKQVRDNIHSTDLVSAFQCFHGNPRVAAVYNIGGGRESNCSMLEAIAFCEEITGRAMNWSYCEDHRNGDHIWWISGLKRFKTDYPEWRVTYDVKAILQEIYDENKERWVVNIG
jgi:CDP-paratose 2-epimerase